MKSGTFSKRSGAATKGFESCEFWFQLAIFNLNTSLYFLGKYACREENNLKISFALYIQFFLASNYAYNRLGKCVLEW